MSFSIGIEQLPMSGRDRSVDRGQNVDVGAY